MIRQVKLEESVPKVAGVRIVFGHSIDKILFGMHNTEYKHAALVVQVSEHSYERSC